MNAAQILADRLRRVIHYSQLGLSVPFSFFIWIRDIATMNDYPREVDTFPGCACQMGLAAGDCQLRSPSRYPATFQRIFRCRREPHTGSAYHPRSGTIR